MAPGGRILVVDDDAALVQSILARLQKAGYRATAAFDRAEALIQADAVPPSLVLCDINMPFFGMGTEAYHDFRKSARLKDIPVVFMTGMPLDEAKRLVPFSDPKIRLLKKPIDWIMLEQAIQELTGDSKPLAD